MHAVSFGAEVIFWFSTFVIGYTYIGYPVMIWGWARLRYRAPLGGGGVSSLSVVVVAHDEGAIICRRLDNLLRCDYPSMRREIIVACDGATDATASAARLYADRGVRVIEFPRRRGKSAVLNDVIPRAHGEIVVLADARQRFSRTVLKNLTSAFDDPSVGAVSGELNLLRGETASQVTEGADAYWRYEKFIRRHEAIVDSTVGVTGAVYAIRKDLFRPIPVETILDDVLIPLRIAEQGYRVLFDGRAAAYDRISVTVKREFSRKTRTIAGNFQLFTSHPRFLMPWRNRLWVQIVSHKALRLAMPGFLILAATSNIVLVPSFLYATTFSVQAGFYALAMLGRLTRDYSHKYALLNVPYTFCVLNWATTVAMARFLGRRYSVAWARTESAAR